VSETSVTVVNKSSDKNSDKSDFKRIRRVLLIPLGLFFLLITILSLGFRLEDPHLLPSVLIDRPFPEFALSDLHDPEQTITVANLKGEVALVNVWATWCPNCLIEHPEFMRIAADEGVPIYGINYNDESGAARRWLERHGNPYRFNMYDNEGKLGIDLGVYGAPETFLIDRDGVIQFKHVGTVTPEIWSLTLKPLIQQLREKS
jgi:cytochrome c biogenesis protein CcmG/thiol:disulfide interchange protein DsbE